MQYSYLALGDSYTIGEAVLLAESFPYLTVQLLRSQKIEIAAPEIIAKTGWTTDELLSEIDTKLFLEKYHFVSLLIGVNNQYRERSIDNYKREFKKLLKKAIGFADNNSTHVFVLSIPDWSTMPFAKDRDIKKIAEEVNAFNEVCKKITLQYNCKYLDITTSQRNDSNNAEMIAADGLHPSALEYCKWAKLLAAVIIKSS
ncbi:MAG: GDSL-type esterase/lipase family protein [Ferruginibacter sp.]|nr:GDSL-type esterase/lipase family protein [Ferruginibacter sp.]